MKTIFKKGDKVWSFSMQEWGKVVHTAYEHNSSCPITVESKSGNLLTYTADGKERCYHKAPDLYFHKVLAPEQKKERQLKHKDIVMCWDNGAKFIRVFGFYNQKQKNTFNPCGNDKGFAYDNMVYVPDEEAPQDLLSMRDKLIEE